MTSKHRTQHPQHNEQQTLIDLAQTAIDTSTAMNDSYDKTDNYDYLDEEFSIIIGGKQFQFILGGPQFQALVDFIKSIAEENGYQIDSL